MFFFSAQDLFIYLQIKFIIHDIISKIIILLI